MKRISISVIYFFGIIFSILFKAPMVIASTVIEEGYIRGVETWEASKSPYVLKGEVTVPSGSLLKIMPGVVVSSDVNAEYGPYLSAIGGEILIQGDNANRVRLEGIRGLYIEKGKLEIIDADLKLSQGITLESSKADISGSTISGSNVGLNTARSHVEIWGSSIYGNKTGINVRMPGRPVLSYEDRDIGGLGDFYDSEYETFLKVENSSIKDNENYGIYNMSTTTLLANSNWWGNKSGPVRLGANRLSGKIQTEKWLDEEPVLSSKFTEICCSNILFLPGLEGSRIFSTSSVLGIIRKNTLWEPAADSDVEQLILDSNGESMPGIFSGDPIDKAFGIHNVYDSFMSFLDRMKFEGKINEWSGYGYDWRRAVNEIVEKDEIKSVNTVLLLSVIKELAKKSKTGKVTIIAHSNGGLVMRHLSDLLLETGDSHILDQLIGVGVPFLGTPQAIFALLHGDGQQIAQGLILKKDTAKRLGINMKSAYSLLPTAYYFKSIFSPTIVFASTSLQNAYRSEIDDLRSQNSFIIDSDNKRGEFNIQGLPIVGNKKLLEKAESLHDRLDKLIWPIPKAQVWSISGVGIATPLTLKYFDKIVCFLGIYCKTSVSHEAVITNQGDGTVIASSSLIDNLNKITLDLNKINDENDTNIRHSNLLESKDVQNVIEQIIDGKKVDDSSKVSLNGSRIKEGKYLVLSTHSPVDLHVYDESGHHTGFIAGVPDDLFIAFEEKIPGSAFFTYGDDKESDTYVYLPLGDNPEEYKKYEVLIKGNGLGTFTFKSEIRQGSVLHESYTYGEMPVGPNSIGRISIDGLKIKNGGTVSSSSSSFRLDLEGDGKIDISLFPGEKIDIESYKLHLINLMEAYIPAGPHKVGIVNKIRHFLKSIEKGNTKNLSNKITQLEHIFSNIKDDRLSDQDKENLLRQLQEWLDSANS